MPRKQQKLLELLNEVESSRDAFFKHKKDIQSSLSPVHVAKKLGQSVFKKKSKPLVLAALSMLAALFLSKKKSKQSQRVSLLKPLFVGGARFLLKKWLNQKLEAFLQKKISQKEHGLI